MARIQCSAPGRAGIIGNPTDMYGGSVISCSIVERATVTLSSSDQLILETGSESCVIESTEDLSIQGDHFDIAKAVLTGTDSADLRVHLTWESSIPFRAGLSGSTALLVSILTSILSYRNTLPSLYNLAELTRTIEYNNLGVFCGYQDAYMCTFGGLNYMDFRDKEFHQKYGTDPYGTIEPIKSYVPSLPFVLINTGGERVSGAIHSPLRDRWLAGEPEVVDAYIAIGKLAREGKKALLNENWIDLGRLMNENHHISRALGGSSPEDDRMIQLALDNGALGAKLAGSGGTIIILHTDPEAMITTLKAAGAKRVMVPDARPGVQVESSE